MNRSRRAFTLLEVTIAMSILAVSLVILMESQGNAVFMTQDAEKVRLATMLAEEKMTEAQLRIEYEGWKNSDIEENGDFDDFGQEDFRGTNLRLDFSDSLDKYKWAYTIRQIDISIPTDLGGMAGDMMEGGYFGEEKNDDMSEQNFDLGDLGISPDMISDYLADYIREVRIRVWWGENEDETDQVELLTHVINPSGVVTEDDEAIQ
jgi:prepilin-type N-terminal cleavage/methylation domain-containing protein